jgi:hypothetical protein
VTSKLRAPTTACASGTGRYVFFLLFENVCVVDEQRIRL